MQHRIQLEKAIKLARQRLHETKIDTEKIGKNENCDIPDNQNTCQKIMLKLLKALERIRDTKNDQIVQSLSGIKRRKRRESSASDEPHFGSMILVGTLQKEEAKALQRGMAAFKDEQNLLDRRKSIPILTDDLPSKSMEDLDVKLEPVLEKEKEIKEMVGYLIHFYYRIYSSTSPGGLLFQHNPGLGDNREWGL